MSCSCQGARAQDEWSWRTSRPISRLQKKFGLGTRWQSQNKVAERHGQPITRRLGMQAQHSSDARPILRQRMNRVKAALRDASFCSIDGNAVIAGGFSRDASFLTDVARLLPKREFNAWVFLRRPDLRPTALRRPAGGGAGTMLRHESGKSPPTFWSAVSDLVVNRRASLNLRGRSCAAIDENRLRPTLTTVCNRSIRLYSTCI